MDLHSKLWDYCYGLLDEAEAESLRAQICSDRAVAREYARVKLQSDLVAQAAKATQHVGDWSALPEGLRTPLRRRGRAREGVRSLMLISSLALSLVLLVYAGVAYWSPDSPVREPAIAQAWESFAEQHPRLIVTGPTMLHRGESARYQAILTRLDGPAIAAEVTASLAAADGTAVWSETALTDAGGVHYFSVPTNLAEDNYRLNIGLKGIEADESDGGKQAELGTWVAVSSVPATEVMAIDRVVDLTTGAAIVQLVDLSDSFESEEEEFELAAIDRAEFVEDNFYEEKDAATEKSKLLADNPRVTWGVQPSRYRAVQPGEDFVALAHDPQEARTQTYNDTVSVPAPAAKIASVSPDAPALADTIQDAPVASPTGGFSQRDFASGAPTPADPDSISATTAPAAGIDGTSWRNKLAKEDGFAVVEREGIRRELGRKSSAKSTEATFVVEAIYANGRLISNRFVDSTHATAEELQSRLSTLPEEGIVAPSFVGELSGVLYDYLVAPPQPVAQESQRIEPKLLPLNIAVRFDRQLYAAGEPASVELRATDENGTALPAVFSVRVDALALGGEELPPKVERDESAPVELNYFVSASLPAAPQFPLVFDNAAQQQQQVQLSTDAWLTQREVDRQHAALVLLFGSGLGYSLLLVAALLKWLPRTGWWLPIASLLGLSFLTGAVWMSLQSQGLMPTSSVIPLTNFGIVSQQPAAIPKATMGQWAMSKQDFDGVALNEQLARFSQSPAGETESKKSMSSNGHQLATPSQWYELAQGVNVRERLSSRLAGQQPSNDFAFDYGNRSVLLFNDDTENLYAIPAQGSGGGGLESNPPLPVINMPTTSRDDLSTSAQVSSETLYWHPLVRSNDHGVAQADFDVPPSPRAYRIQVQAHSAGRYGESSVILPTIVDFHP